MGASQSSLRLHAPARNTMAPKRSKRPRSRPALISAALALVTACGPGAPIDARSELQGQGETPTTQALSSESATSTESAGSNSSPQAPSTREQLTRSGASLLQNLKVSESELDLGTPERPILLRPAKPQDIAPPSPFREHEAGEPHAELRQAQAEAVARARAIAEACEAGRAAAAQGSGATPRSAGEAATARRDESQGAPAQENSGALANDP